MEKVKTATSLFLFLFINFAFAVKYISDITPHYILISIASVVFYGMLWYFRSQIRHIAHRFRYFNLVLVVCFVLFFAFIFTKIPSGGVNVDRWSVITSFWDNYFAGKYVYFAQSYAGNYPGPMPFYFVLALPFYLVGELGYFSLLGIIAFILLMRFNAKSRAMTAAYLILTMASLFYLWEVTCRSNLLFNGVLVLLSITYFFKSCRQPTRKSMLWNGIIIGLFLSTRNVFVIPYIIAFLFVLKYRKISIKDLLLLGTVSMITFAVTFLPFVIGHLEDFKQMNPFIIQSSFLMPLGYTAFCLVLALAAFFTVKQESDVYFYSGLILFIAIVLHYIYKLTIYNFNEVFFGSRADISYFILCVPFLLYYLIEKEDVRKFG